MFDLSSIETQYSQTFSQKKGGFDGFKSCLTKEQVIEFGSEPIRWNIDNLCR
jgi:hypothetical protein